MTVQSCDILFATLITIVSITIVRQPRLTTINKASDYAAGLSCLIIQIACISLADATHSKLYYSSCSFIIQQIIYEIALPVRIFIVYLFYVMCVFLHTEMPLLSVCFVLLSVKETLVALIVVFIFTYR